MIESILWIFFVLACLLTCGIVLLQEGKGGGLGEAFGGAGQQMVGVKAEGITKLTGYLAVAVVVLAIVITKMRTADSAISYTPPEARRSEPGVMAPATNAGETGAAGQPATGGDGEGD